MAMASLSLSLSLSHHNSAWLRTYLPHPSALLLWVISILQLAAHEAHHIHAASTESNSLPHITLLRKLWLDWLGFDQKQLGSPHEWTERARRSRGHAAATASAPGCVPHLANALHAALPAVCPHPRGDRPRLEPSEQSHSRSGRRSQRERAGAVELGPGAGPRSPHGSTRRWRHARRRRGARAWWRWPAPRSCGAAGHRSPEVTWSLSPSSSCRGPSRGCWWCC
jgi:hypothetical protein